MAQMAIPNINIEYYMNLVVRRKWWIIVPVLLSILAGAVHIKITPKSYKANTLIMVQAQKVPSSYVTSTVTESLQNRLHTITQQVYSRTNLEKIIKQFDLADNAENREEKSTAKIVENLRRKININLRGRGRTQAFEISFQWHDPKTVAIVTNAVASQFIEQNLKVREDMAMGTTAFLENESEKIKLKLEAQEKTLKLFNKEHRGSLPSELQSNLNILGQLKEELNHLEARIQSENEQAVMLQKQAQMLQMVQMQSSDLEIVSDEEGVMPSENITYLESQLSQLRLRYTEKHPDVVALNRKISIIQQTLNADMNEEELSIQEPVEDSPDQSDNLLVVQQDQMKFQLETINKNIESYQKKINNIKKEIQFYNNRIERIPEVELELTKLTRDYSTMRSRYLTLLQKKINARMAEQLERRQKGEQFKVLDPAITPNKPENLDVKRVMLLALMAGFGIGCGLAYLREIIDGSFYSADDLESFLGSKVLVSIPSIQGNI